MENISSVHLKHIQSRLGTIAYQLTKVQFLPLSPRSCWTPSVNAYQCNQCVVICMDLAGVDKKQINVQVEPRRLLVRGQRQPLAPDEVEGLPLQILALEIDEGSFERELILPVEVDPDGVKAEQRNGMLWIWLPLPSPRRTRQTEERL